jgi:DNA primase
MPEDSHLKWGEHEVFAYRGILIPWMMPGDCDKFYRLNIRLSPNDDRGKYKNIKGGTSQALYFARGVVPNKPVVMVEGEFDALVIASEIVRHQQKINRTIDLGVVATGSTTGGRTMRWLALLRMASKVLVAFDNDDNKAGDEASKWWLQALPNAKRYAPTSHDVTDMWKSGHDVIEWLREGVMK